MMEESDYEIPYKWRMSKGKFEEEDYSRKSVERIVLSSTYEKFFDEYLDIIDGNGANIPDFKHEIELEWSTEEPPVPEMDEQVVCKAKLKVKGV